MNRDIKSEKRGNSNKENKPILITQNVVMEGLLHKIKLVAKTHATVLIMGENGTGKEVIAKLLHYHSSRKNNPMVNINCGAVPSELVESELFGHEKGSFTGAHSRKEGAFELADKGTLFLDEVGEMPKSMQVKLLRAVELSSFRRVGGKEEVQVDITLISATNKVLIDQVKSGSFREDLYYRLNVIELYVPPLRHRRDDIPLLVSYYQDYFTDRYSIEKINFTDECIEMFMAYDWPGNVRELKNVVERCIVLSEGGEVNLDTIPSRIHQQEKMYPIGSGPSNILQIPIGSSLEEIEQRVIDRTLNSVDNNKTEAAKILGFSRKTLHNKLDKYHQQKSGS